MTIPPIGEIRVYLRLKLSYDGGRLVRSSFNNPVRPQSIKDALPHESRI